MAKRKKTSETDPAAEGAAPEDVRGDGGEVGEEAGPAAREQASPGEQVAPETAPASQASRLVVEPDAESDADPGDELPAEGLPEEALEDDLPAIESAERLASIVESLIFAADKPLTLPEIKRLAGIRDSGPVEAAVETVRARHAEGGIQLVSVAGGVQFRTHPTNGPWVSKLVAGRPVRLSRAMMETLAIVAYRQPITRPEIDDIRGVDSGPVLRTLLDRGLIRTLGKKEEVGRPLLYGTTPDFLKTFSLKDLTELPSLREFHELGEADMARVNASAKGAEPLTASPIAGPPPGSFPRPTDLTPPDPKEEEELLSALDDASNAAARATKQATEPAEAPAPAEGESSSS
jgi:segregation and condensation protein B